MHTKKKSYVCDVEDVEIGPQTNSYDSIMETLLLTSNQQVPLTSLCRSVAGEGLLNKAMDILGKKYDNTSYDLVLKEYIKFLSKYGSFSTSISDVGFNIFGPISSCETDEEKVEYMASIQRSFDYRFKDVMSDEQMKYCWLIAKIDQGNNYCIDFSDEGKGYIYSIDNNKKREYFARDFEEFLNELIKACTKKGLSRTYVETTQGFDQEEDSDNPEDSDQGEDYIKNLPKRFYRSVSSSYNTSET